MQQKCYERFNQAYMETIAGGFLHLFHNQCYPLVWQGYLLQSGVLIAERNNQNNIKWYKRRITKQKITVK